MRRLKLLLDENIGLKVYEEFKKRGYKAQTVIKELRDAPDEEILRIAVDHGKIVVSMDKDFGYLAQAYNPPGILLLRLKIPTIPRRLEAILRALQLDEKLYNNIMVVTETSIRRRPIK